MSRPYIVATTIAAVLLLGACGNTDASESDVRDVLEEAGATDEQASCAAGQIAEELDQDELNDLAGADTIDDIPNAIEEKVTPILDECLGEAGSDGPVVDEDESPETDGETTETTEAEGAGTTTTTAAGGTGDTTTTTAG